MRGNRLTLAGDEAPLGRTGDKLSGEMNRLSALAREAERDAAEPPEEKAARLARAGKPGYDERGGRLPLLCKVPTLLSLMHESGQLTCGTEGCQVCGGSKGRQTVASAP